MRTQIPVPSKGDAMRASWGASVASRVNELCAMAPAGMLSRDGFGGMGAQPLPQNLRDRRGAAGQPMPFDLKAELQTNQAGTQRRLVVKWYYGGVPTGSAPVAAVWWNYWVLTFSGHQAPGQDTSGFITAYTGTWASAENFSDGATIQLWYTLQLGPNFNTDPITLAVSGSWRVVSSDQVETLGLEEDIQPSGANPIITTYINLGVVRASGSSIVGVWQQHHGNLYINELPYFGDGGGGGNDDESASAQRGCWKLTLQEPEYEGEGVGSFIISDCYYNVGGITKLAGPFSVSAAAEGFLCALFAIGGNVSVVIYATQSALASAQANENTYIVPLYEIGSGTVLLDMRNAPQIQVFEGTL